MTVYVWSNVHRNIDVLRNAMERRAHGIENIFFLCLQNSVDPEQNVAVSMVTGFETAIRSKLCSSSDDHTSETETLTHALFHQDIHRRPTDRGQVRP